MIEGGVVLRGRIWDVRRLRAGDSHFFRPGAHAEWHVEDYIRKFALIRTPCRAVWCLRSEAIGSSSDCLAAAAARTPRRP